MKNLVPRYIDETEARRFGIQRGWYGARVNGTLITGQCATEEECMEKIIQHPEPAVPAKVSTKDKLPNEKKDKPKSADASSTPSFRTVTQIGYGPIRPVDRRS